jgi:hypothetical protein
MAWAGVFQLWARKMKLEINMKDYTGPAFCSLGPLAHAVKSISPPVISKASKPQKKKNLQSIFHSDYFALRKLRITPMFGNIVVENTESKLLLQLVPTFGIIRCS